MPHPPSPQNLSERGLPNSIGAVSPSKDPVCAPTHLHSQLRLPSPPSKILGSQNPSATSTIFLKRTLSRNHQYPPAVMDFDDSPTIWAACDLSISEFYHNQHSAPHSRRFGPNITTPFEYTPNGLPYTTNCSFMYPASLGDNPNCPHSYADGVGHTCSMEDMTMGESYPPSAYVIEAPKLQDGVNHLASQSSQDSQLQPMGCDHDPHHYISSSIKLEDPDSDSSSPYGSPAGTRCSTPFNDLPPPITVRRDMKEENGAIDKEQPYAQLIYRALMDAPGNTMILRDIYQWFMVNTDKAADKETKGWQNSIRHNLSMNGAFEKVDQPCEDARKGFMWKLTDEAIRDGVKSTTRFRSKQPNKRCHRSQHPLPQRQASGAKGGQAAKRSAKLRRSQRTNGGYARRNAPYICRSVPLAYDHTGFDTCIDIPMAYPSSPFYSGNINYGQLPNHDDFGSSLVVPTLDLRSGYSTPPLSQDILTYETSYAYPQEPPEPLFYDTDTTSPSPPACDEPCTPESQVDCYIETGRPMEGAYAFEDVRTDYQG